MSALRYDLGYAAPDRVLETAYVALIEVLRALLVYIGVPLCKHATYRTHRLPLLSMLGSLSCHSLASGLAGSSGPYTHHQLEVRQHEVHNSGDGLEPYTCRSDPGKRQP